MHCSGVILAHSSTVFKSWRFHGPLLWTLIFRSYFLMDSGQVIGWATQAAFIFFLRNQLRISLAVFEFIVLLKCPPLFHHHPSTVGVGTEPANINFHWPGQDCFLITDRLQLVSWLFMPFRTFLSSCVQYFFPVSFHFTFSHLADAFIQSDLQMKTMEAIKINKKSNDQCCQIGRTISSPKFVKLLTVKIMWWNVNQGW